MIHIDFGVGFHIISLVSTIWSVCCLLFVISVCVLVSAHHRLTVPTQLLFGLPILKVRTPIQSHRLNNLEGCDQISHDVRFEVDCLAQVLFETLGFFCTARMPGEVTG